MAENEVSHLEIYRLLIEVKTTLDMALKQRAEDKKRDDEEKLDIFKRLNALESKTAVWLGIALAASFIMGMIGVLAGLWSEKFDHLAAVQNFIVMPMTFLSGTFYLVENLPEPFRTISRYNPFFYLIDGFRYGFIGHAESNLTVGVIGSAVLMVIMGTICWLVFRSGWRLKS